MREIRHGYLVVEGCSNCNARSSFFSTEPVAPIDEYQEGKHHWINLGSSQAVKFDLECDGCGKVVVLDDMMGLMLSTCEDQRCEVARTAAEGGPGTWVYVALCADSTHASGKCVTEASVAALAEYFNANIKAADKEIVILPCIKCRSIDLCRGIVIADAGLAEMY